MTIRQSASWLTWLRSPGEWGRRVPSRWANTTVRKTSTGPDGRAATGDERTVAAFSLNPINAALPIQNLVFNPNGYTADYKSVEVGVNKRFSNRWSVVASFLNSWISEYGTSYYATGNGNNVSNTASLFGSFTLSSVGGELGSAFPITPNGLQDKSEFSVWNLKISGMFEPAYGIRITPVLKTQQGHPYGRVFRANAGAIAQNFLAESITANRLETTKLLDIRVDKRFKLTNRIGLQVLFDVFNVFNANTELNVRASTGTLTVSESGAVIPQLNTPTTILPPRIARISARLSW